MMSRTAMASNTSLAECMSLHLEYMSTSAFPTIIPDKNPSLRAKPCSCLPSTSAVRSAAPPMTVDNMNASSILTPSCLISTNSSRALAFCPALTNPETSAVHANRPRPGMLLKSSSASSLHPFDAYPETSAVHTTLFLTPILLNTFRASSGTPHLQYMSIRDDLTTSSPL
uniref:Uncharacterized protein n=1 Tax=Arundo donax TaxID=35708 RepID=A0A0A9G8C5_ARUDO